MASFGSFNDNSQQGGAYGSYHSGAPPTGSGDYRLPPLSSSLYFSQFYYNLNRILDLHFYFRRFSCVHTAFISERMMITAMSVPHDSDHHSLTDESCVNTAETSGIKT